MASVEERKMATNVAQALRSSHDHLRALANRLSAVDLGAQSYCEGWTISQVFSHLGSGAEIASLWLHAAVDQADPPGRETIQDTWARWNVKAPTEQVRDMLTIDDDYIRTLECMTFDDLSAACLVLPQRTLDGHELATARLVEHILHTWDIEVAFDPATVLFGPTCDDLLEFVRALATHRGKPTERRWTLNIHTREPSRGFLLAVSDGVRVEAIDADDWNADGTLTLDAEAWVRLVYGRLDANHAQNVQLVGRALTLDDVRSVFAS